MNNNKNKVINFCLVSSAISFGCSSSPVKDIRFEKASTTNLISTEFESDTFCQKSFGKDAQVVTLRGDPHCEIAVEFPQLKKMNHAFLLQLMGAKDVKEKADLQRNAQLRVDAMVLREKLDKICPKNTRLRLEAGFESGACESEAISQKMICEEIGSKLINYDPKHRQKCLRKVNECQSGFSLVTAEAEDGHLTDVCAKCERGTIDRDNEINLDRNGVGFRTIGCGSSEIACVACRIK